MTAINKKPWPLDTRTISNIIVLVIGVVLYMCLSNFTLVQQKLSMFMNVVSPFILGFAVAYLLNSPMCFLEEKIFKKIRWRRGLSILTVYLLALAVLAILLNLVLPQVVESIKVLIGNAEIYLNNLNALVNELAKMFNIESDSAEALVVSYQDLVNRAIEMITSAVPKLFNFGMAVGNGVIAVVTALISSIYMLAGKTKLLDQIHRFIYAFVPKNKADTFLGACHRANGIFVGFINGKLLDSAIIGVLCFVLTSLLSIPFAVLISVVVGVTNIIPFFGPIIGGVPCVMMLLIIDPWSALKFGILVILLQQFDGNILGPKILGDSTGISAIWVLVSIVVGGGLFGFPGMLLGVPTFAVIYMTMRDVVDARLKARRLDGEGNRIPPEPPEEQQ